MTRIMLDTNIAGLLLKRQANVVARVASTPPERLCLSAVTAGEILYGVARRPEAKRLRAAVDELLAAVEILPWTSATAPRYGIMRAELEKRGKPLGALDLMIAAHAVEHDALLATNDPAFRMAPGLRVEDWTVA